MASLSTILIIGADTIAAAHPATPAQLVHACHRLGFSAVVPASWGDELIATEILRRCSDRATRPALLCSCPYVAERLGSRASLLDDSVMWMVSPPVAVARYLRAMDRVNDMHLTYAGDCPGARDTAIDEHITSHDLLDAMRGRGVDPLGQPTVFENIVPADRRRHVSSPGGVPEQNTLWETASFRVAHPDASNLTVSVAQLLLAEDRVLIDCGSELGCICRSTKDVGTETTLLRSLTPVVAAVEIDLARPAPAPPAIKQPSPPASTPLATTTPTRDASRSPTSTPRPSPARPVYRRQSTWRRQSPRPGMVVARTSGIAVAVDDRVPLMNRPEARWVITAIIAAAALFVGLWAGRHTAPPPQAGAAGPVGSIETR